MKIAKSLLAALLIATCFGCTNMTPTQQGALSGGALGALGGAGISALAGGNAGVGALLGGAMGSVAGAIVGHERSHY